MLKYPQEDSQLLRNLFKNKENTQKFELELKDGRIYERYSVPMLDSNDKYLGRISFYRDISDFRKIERELKERNERYRLTMEATSVAVWDMNIVTDEIYLNPYSYKMMGFEQQELAGTKSALMERIHSDDKLSVEKAFNECLTNKDGITEVEFRIRKKQVSSSGYCFAAKLLNMITNVFRCE